MNITELKEQINALNLLEQFSDIHGYSLTLKEIGGVVTNDLCVQFYVEEKKSLEHLAPEQILPSTLLALGLDIITDVKQANKNYHLGITTEEDPLSGSISSLDYFNDPAGQTTDPLRLNYLKNRPLLGGSSSIFISGSDATLGLMVTDSTDNSIVALSNSHVYANSQFVGKDAYKGKLLNTLPLSSRQPGTLYNTDGNIMSPYGNIDPNADCIGIHKRCVALSTLSSNRVDVALTQLADTSLVHAMSTQVNGFNFKGPYQFASTQEIDSLMNFNSPNYQSPIFRSGRTLGPMGYPGNIYSKPHYNVDYSDAPIKEIPIPNIEAAWFASMLGSWIVPEFALIIKTVDGDYWASNDNVFNYSTYNWHQYFPTLPQKDAFTYLGKFNYLTMLNGGTIGLSGNKLVHWGQSLFFTLTSGGPVNRTSGQGGQYIELPSNLQLNDYTNLKTIIPCTYSYGTSYSTFLLKGNELYSVGVNGQGTLGFGVSGTRVNSWTRVPGNWQSITPLYKDSAILALSASGDIFITSKVRSVYMDIPPLSNTFDLTANNLNLGKHIYVASDQMSTIWTLSTNNTITKLNRYKYNTALSAYDRFTYSNNWTGSGIKMIGGELSTDYPLILSGTKVFSAGSMGASYKTSFFRNATTGSSAYNLLTGIDVGYIDGWSQSSYWSYVGMNMGETIVYLSAGKWYTGGNNVNNVFATALTGRDDIIVSSIGYNVLVSGYLNNGNVKFTDCIEIASKDSNFPVTQGGDSGTAVFALLSSKIPALSAWKCIGLVFAGPEPANNAAGIVCRIDNIVDQLKIKPWNGIIPTTKSTIKNITYSSALTAIPTITLSGRQFFNIGVTA